MREIYSFWVFYTFLYKITRSTFSNFYFHLRSNGYVYSLTDCQRFGLVIRLFSLKNQPRLIGREIARKRGRAINISLSKTPATNLIFAAWGTRRKLTIGCKTNGDRPLLPVFRLAFKLRISWNVTGNPGEANWRTTGHKRGNERGEIMGCMSACSNAVSTVVRVAKDRRSKDKNR